jgi:hypothetical protein
MPGRPFPLLVGAAVSVLGMRCQRTVDSWHRSAAKRERQSSMNRRSCQALVCLISYVFDSEALWAIGGGDAGVGGGDAGVGGG